MDYVKALQLILEDYRSNDIPIVCILGVLDIVNDLYDDIGVNIESN